MFSRFCGNESKKNARERIQLNIAFSIFCPQNIEKHNILFSIFPKLKIPVDRAGGGRISNQ